MKHISEIITHDREFSESFSAIKAEMHREKPRPIVVNGLSVAAGNAYCVQMADKIKRECGSRILVVASSEKERDTLFRAFSDFGFSVDVFKPRDLVFYNISASHDVERERLSVLSRLLLGKSDVVVTTPQAAALYTLHPRTLADSSLSLCVGDDIPPEELCAKLSTLGFTRVDLVEAPGQYARRGGIIDFYSSQSESPVRVEFFGDEIDRISGFDLLSQRSLDSIPEVSLLPAIEVMIDSGAEKRLISVVEGLIEKCEIDSMRQSLKTELSALESRASLLPRDKYLDIIYREKSTIFDYFDNGGVVFVSGTAEGEEALKRKITTTAEQSEMLFARGLLPKSNPEYYMPITEYRKTLGSYPLVNINPFAGVKGGELGGLFGFRTRRTVGYGDNNYSLLTEDLSAYVKGGYRVIIMAPNKAGAESLLSTFTDDDFKVSYIPSVEKINLPAFGVGSIILTIGTGEGYDLITPKIALLSTDRDEGAVIMAERRAKRLMKRMGGGARIMSHNDLRVGDYVVHATYGIGLFEGIETIRALGETKDYITIRYAGTDKLHIPCDKVDTIARYIGATAADGTVKLSKMGGSDWQRTKSKAKGAVRDIAGKLLKLYAERQKTEGYAYPADSELEDEFSASFEYEETESQRVAIEEIKTDMMKPHPMNRLLLGDVGYGKTEVALRAAFKAIMGGKQVAILVPTTILALQHYQTALSRMRGYAVNVEMISRFRTTREISKILEKTADGKVDILIGTHKLLSGKVEFRRLGLLIIDEEQRFGVSQKEKLKEMSVGVDVLTLSATPIPRTLNMAMNGISDMSVLEEPPGDRRPVQTYVLEHDDPVIFDAIRRELFRSGQVLYLYNNIETISLVAGKIQKEIPEARVAYAHGQMDKDELEDIWQMLIRGEIDVLICTTIIETGVDLPNANTLIIENADRMGLSQLHQIRGRVGRSERQAYAYFTYRPGKALSEIATKRLSAIREYAEFGAGFKVALRDLEIRGAGNILGAEQHGYIDGVGYDLYIKLLNEAVAEARGVVTPKPFESVIDIKLDAYIPEHYISSSSLRMEMYKRIADIASPDDKSDVYDELTDRFGNVPRACERLLAVALSRAISEMARISRVLEKSGCIYFYTEKPDMTIWGQLVSRYDGRLRFSNTSAPVYYKLASGEDAIFVLEDILKNYYSLMPKED